MKTLTFFLSLCSTIVLGQDLKTDSTSITSENRSACLERMKTGDFEYRSNGSLIEIKRTKKRQIESYGGYKIKTYVTWDTDSTFRLKSYEMDISGCMKIGDEIKISITTCKDNKYTASYTSEKCGNGSTEFTKVD